MTYSVDLKDLVVEKRRNIIKNKVVHLSRVSANIRMRSCFRMKMR